MGEATTTTTAAAHAPIDVNYLATLGLLAALCAVMLATGNAHAEMAFGAVLTYAGVQSPRSPIPARLGSAASVLPLVVALAVGAVASGCTPAALSAGVVVGEIAAKVSCDGARKLCDVFGRSDACDVIETVCGVLSPSSGSGGESSDAPDGGAGSALGGALRLGPRARVRRAVGAAEGVVGPVAAADGP